MTKRLPCLIMALLFAFSLRASPPIGAVVQTWRYDAPTSNVIVRIINTSGKDITGWTIKITETYDNGQTNEHEYSTDLLQLMFTVQESVGNDLRAQFGNGTFQAGSYRDEKIPVAHPIKDFEASFIVVVYADKTAEATSQEALGRAISARNVAASTIRTANDIIKKAIATSANPDVDAAAKLTALEMQWKMQRHFSYDLDTGMLEGMIRDLKNAPRIAADQKITVNEHLNNYLAERGRRAALLSDHSKVQGGAQ